MLDKLFGLTKAKTSVKTEIMAGVATFLTMAYITVVNPAILSCMAHSASTSLSSLGCPTAP